MKKIDVSVIIPAYNEEKFIEKSIRSVKEQKTKLNYEIIVVDNNSKDRTKEIAKEQNVKVVSEKKQGVGAARRTGTENAKGEIVVHIDADTRLYPNHLEKVKKFFEEDKELACLGGYFVFYDAPMWKSFFRKVLYSPLVYFAKTSSKGALGPMGNNMAFKRSFYEGTKGFNKNLKFGEDMEICKELKKFGKIKTCPNLKVKVSSRRYKLSRKFVLYSMNFISMCTRGKPYKNDLPTLGN